MMMKKRFLAIRREPMYSPYRQRDDALTLQAVADELISQGFEGRIVDADEVGDVINAPFNVILSMCEGRSILERLRDAAPNALIINSPASVLNCYRVNQIPLLKGCPDVLIPKSEVFSIEEALPIPSSLYTDGLWIKQGDAHKTYTPDVLFARRAQRVVKIRDQFRRRGIQHLVFQQPVKGEHIKFYGVGPGKWFTWFYPNSEGGRTYPVDVHPLEESAFWSAKVLGLEVFGGDAIVDREGRFSIIDVNSWPSFAVVRDQARLQIADHILTRLSQTDSKTVQAESDEKLVSNWRM